MDEQEIKARKFAEVNDQISNDKSNAAKEAEKYIQQETGHVQKAADIKVDENGQIVVDKRRKITINHAGVANDITKIANMVPGLSPMSRKVLSIRVINPGITTMGISLATGISEMDVKAYERDGLERIKGYLRDNLNYKDAAEKAAKDNVVSRAIAGELNKQGSKNSLLKGNV